MHSLRKPLFLPVWAANLFERVDEHTDDDRWYGRMMDALLECDDWNGFYHRQTAALLETLALPCAGSAESLVRQTIELHRDRLTDQALWDRHYHSLFEAAYTDPCVPYSLTERQAIKASLHGCLETPLRSRPFDPVWSVVFAVSAAGGCEESGWKKTARLLLDTAKQGELEGQLAHG